MSHADSKQQHTCQNEEIAAYLDGELDGQSSALFEKHLKECRQCAALLQEQRLLLCTLDFALGKRDAGEIELPANFSQVVMAHAQSDLGGLRTERVERRRALRLCLALAVASFALLGSAAVSEKVVKPLGLLFRHAGTILSLIGHALYNLGAGLAVIARAVGGHTIFESHRLAPLFLLLLTVAVIMLPRLISNYHRTRIGLEEAARGR